MDDLVERLRAVKWEPTDDAERMPDDPTLECVHVDMRPADFLALLAEAADALEAAREDAGRYRWLRNESRAGKGMIPAPILATEDFDVGDCETDGFVFGAELDAAIDDAKKETRNG